MLRIFLIIGTLLALQANGQSIQIKTVDKSGAAFAKVLIIVRYADDFQEVARVMTNSEGQTSTISVRKGLLQIIATCPYGLCKSGIWEVLAVNPTLDKVVLPLDLRSTDEAGQMINTHNAKIHIKQGDNNKTGVMDFLVRDEEGIHQKWYRTDSIGTATFELVGDPTFITVLWQDRIYRFSISEKCPTSGLNHSLSTSCIKTSDLIDLKLVPAEKL